MIRYYTYIHIPTGAIWWENSWNQDKTRLEQEFRIEYRSYRESIVYGINSGTNRWEFLFGYRPYADSPYRSHFKVIPGVSMDEFKIIEMEK